MNRDSVSKGSFDMNVRKMKEQKEELEEAFNDCSMKIHSII